MVPDPTSGVFFTGFMRLIIYFFIPIRFWRCSKQKHLGRYKYGFTKQNEYVILGNSFIVVTLWKYFVFKAVRENKIPCFVVIVVFSYMPSFVLHVFRKLQYWLKLQDLEELRSSRALLIGEHDLWRALSSSPWSSLIDRPVHHHWVFVLVKLSLCRMWFPILLFKNSNAPPEIPNHE